MITIVPKSLIDLPEPWRNLKADLKGVLVTSDADRAVALQVLDRCLQAVEELHDVSPDEFPDFVTVSWSLWASSFVTLMPSFDEFRLEPIAEAFRKQESGVTEEFVHRYALAWLRKQALARAQDAQNWLFDSLRASWHAETLAGLRQIVERYWRADHDLAFSLLHSLWVLDQSGSTALLEKVAASPDASEKLSTELRQLLAH